ncbi:MAG: hypothetical protein K5695_06390 [Oscillospiraceae bacterium]|nr:hypothetical protein [Oscillospiraceae bacterium]
MLQSEFEILADIFPDAILYECIEQAYNSGPWLTKQEFCDAYNVNQGGLAEAVQRAANERLIELGEGSAHHMKIRAQMAETIKALTDELESIEAAYDRAMSDMLSPTLKNMIKDKVKEMLR